MMKTSQDTSNKEQKAWDEIVQIKKELGSSLLILGHYYQRLNISQLSDQLGDSYALSAKAAASEEAKHIVFCGVRFMAESAEILRSPNQIVYHPHNRAGCPMADMASLDDVEKAFESIAKQTGKKIIPVAYMNTSSEVKAFCGKNGGLICTSSNADKAFKWAYDKGDLILFLPDEHLGNNTANKLNISIEERALWDPSAENGLNAPEVNSATKLVLWKGHCHVHTWFTPEMVDMARDKYPGAKVVVHPECPSGILAKADASGSTAFMLNYVRDAAEGDTLVVGTEINMVKYLEAEFGSRKKVLPLDWSFCPNMYKINLENLRDNLRSLDQETFRVEVASDIKENAKIALTRMLEIS